MKIKCIIIDDEPLAQNVIEKYVSTLESFELVCKCKNAIEAISYLQQNIVDVMFLDINMPDLSGIEMLKTLKYFPQVIITTAFSEYALESYEYEVVDYLLKPISFERFLKAVNRLKININKENISNQTQYIENKQKHVFLKSNKVTHKIKLADISYIEGCGNYLKVVTPSKNIMIYEKMNTFEQMLTDTNFIRIHKSYIIAFDKIEQIEGNTIEILKKTIPIGRMYKKNLLDRI